MCRLLYIALFTLAVHFGARGQGNTAFGLKDAGYARLVERKIVTYHDRLTGRTEKALVRLSRWEDRLRKVVEKSSPATAQKLFGEGQPTFSRLLQQMRAGEMQIHQYQSRYDGYRDTLATTLKYLAAEAGGKAAQALKDAQQQVAALDSTVALTDDIQKFIRQRRKLLMFSENEGAGQPRPVPPAYPSGAAVNSVRTWSAVKKEKEVVNVTNNVSPDKFIITTQFTDGYGRPLQTVIKQGALATGSAATDMVGIHTYDGMGREPVQYLPYADVLNNGAFKNTPFEQQQAFYSAPDGILKSQPETYFYSETIFDGSPLNRVIKTMAPGNSWVGNQKGVEYEYLANSATEKIHIWDVGFATGAMPVTSAANVYGSGQLYKNITKDENGKQVINYTDKNGNTVLNKVQDKESGGGLTGEHEGWLCTYYVYDDFGRMRFVIPPKAVAYLDTHNWMLNTDVVNELCFSYQYDSRGRPVVKKAPGAEAVYIVYDVRDRAVFVQDGNLRTGTPQKWMATLYDNLDRPTLSGMIDFSGTRQALQSQVNSVANTGKNEILTINSLSVTVNGNPLPSGNNLYVLSITYYDDYAYDGAKSFSTGFTIDNEVPTDEQEEVEKSSRTLGYITGTKVRLLDGGNTFLTTTSFYDSKGRTIQVVGDNHKGFTDEMTTQYDFSGKVRSTCEVHRFNNNEEIKIFTRNEYDLLGRLAAINKTINEGQEKAIAAYAYDALGRLSGKTLAPGFSGPDGAWLEKLDYSYNIHGWLLGINKTYAASSSPSGHFFGMELGYDRPGSAGFANTQLNGNISGNAWKSRGDNVARKYDFEYDNVNQLTNAAFNQQNTPGAGWTKDKMDFSSAYSYDENGNIKTQNQWGVAIGSAPQQIDQLVYNYDMVAGGWSNRLKQIAEGTAPGVDGQLGDFKNGAAGGNVQQYTYDPNGNLLKDLNKEIGNSSTEGIAYNYMNLPTLITFKNTNKTIAYVYDAAGNKLRKILDEPAHDNKPARHIETDYLNGFVYQNNELQFFFHEEGRIRKAENGDFVYDYFIKDHLSNTRMVLTEEQQVDHYPTATLEGSGTGSALSQEQDYYDINISYVVNKPTNVSPSNLLDYINDNGTDNPHTFGNKNAVSQKMYRLNGATNRTGYSKILKVMAGDKIDILAKSYYHYSGGNIPKNTLLAADIISAFLGVAGGGNAAVQHGATSSILNGNNAGLVLPLNIFTNSNPENPLSHIKAGLNYIVFDENFNYVSAGYDPVSGEQAGGLKNHFIQNIEIPQNGYIYIYCSNESNTDLFFDNLEIIHTRGQILEENHYYSYGLKMAAISSKAAGVMQNNYLYQGDFSEYDGETGYNEFDLRHYDAQTGRWTTADPYQQFASPYLGMGNSPGGMVDPDGGSIFGILSSDAPWLWQQTVDAAAGFVIGAAIGAATSNGKYWLEGGIAGAGATLIGGNWNAISGALGSAGNWVGGLFQGGSWQNVSVLLAQSAFNGAGSGDDWIRNPNPQGITISDLANESNNRLLNDLRSTIRTYTSGVFKDIGDKMVDHFAANTGTDFSDPILNNQITASSQFQNSFHNVLQLIKTRILDINGDFSLYGTPQNFMNPSFPKWDVRNPFLPNSLYTLIGGTQYSQITLTSYKYNSHTKSFKGRITTIIMDDFGVSASDVKKASKIPFSKGIRSMWYLQHIRGYKPFRTIYKRQFSIKF